MENGAQNLGRIFSSNCVQSVAHIQTCHKPSPTYDLIQIARFYFFSLKAMGQVKESKNGNMTFDIDTGTAPPGYLCRSQGGSQAGEFPGVSSAPEDIHWAR